MKQPDKKAPSLISKTLFRNHHTKLSIASAAIILAAFIGCISFVGVARRVSANPEPVVTAAATPVQATKRTSDELWQSLPNTDALKQRDPGTLSRSFAAKILDKTTLANLLNQAPLEFTRVEPPRAVDKALPLDQSIVRFAK